jgi:hypothetical protein
VEREAQRLRELQAAQQLARTQRQRSLVLSVGLLIAIVLGLLSFIFYRQSNANLDTTRAANTQVAAVAAAAKADANIAIGRQALAQAQILPFDSATSIFQRGLLKVEGLQRAPGLEAVGVAQQASSILGRPVVKMVHDSFVSAVAFSPDGRWIVTGSDDGTIRVWAWQTQDVIDLLCARLPRNFTKSERQQFFGEVPYRQTCENLPEGK